MQYKIREIQTRGEVINFLLYALSKAETAIEGQSLAELLSVQYPMPPLTEEEQQEFEQQAQSIENEIDHLFVADYKSETVEYKFKETTTEEIKQAIVTLHDRQMKIMLALQTDERIDLLKALNNG